MKVKKMPAKLDRCVYKVMEKGKDKSFAFAVCNKSLGLTKTAISSKLARKVFEARYLKELAAKEYSSTHSDPISLIDRNTSLNKAKHLVRKNRLVSEKARNKSLRALEMFTNRKEWEANKAEYGTRSPSIISKIKHGLSKVLTKARGNANSGLSSAVSKIKTPTIALQVS